MIRRFLVASLLAVAVWQFGASGYVQAKAALGQYLLDRAWQDALESDAKVMPWPGAVSHPVARLRVPRLSVDQLVLDGLETPVLAWGPGMAVGPGGHHVIAAHRDTHFSFLRALKVGDRLELVRRDGRRQQWQVVTIRVVDSRRVAIDLGWDARAMTLITCYPFDAIVSGGPHRLLVRLEPIGPAPGVAS